MILVKVRNAGELLWDSLDSQERAIVGFACFYLTVTMLALLRSASRERMKRELREEIAAGGV